MFGIEQLLDFPYETIKQFILNKEPFMLEALKDIRIKEKLINCNKKYDFIWLVQEIPDEYANQLFDDEGIKILRQTPELIAKMNGILTCGKKYINKILEIPEICKIVVNHCRDCIYSLDEKGALNLIKYMEENDPDKIKRILVNLSGKTQENVVKKINIPTNELTYYVFNLKAKATEYLVNNDIRITSLESYSFDQLYNIFSKEFCLNPSFFKDKKFIKKLVSMSSVKDYRFLVNELSKANDITDIEEMRKDYYMSEINSYNHEFKMLERYYVCYKKICNLIDNGGGYGDFKDIIEECFNFFGVGHEEKVICNKLLGYVKNQNKEDLKKFLQAESNLQMSNMIIDYHFEEVPYNFFLDINQLCNFQKGEGKTLTDEEIGIYQRLLNIDSLSYDEKINLHKELEKEDWIGKNYDIFRTAKEKAATLIKEQMLNETNIMNYCNLKLTQDMGVPIYELIGQEYCALVKSIGISKEKILTENDIIYSVDGSSFSLDGSKKLSTFENPREYYNLIYSDFSINQVIHMYPVDSFSYYDRSNPSKTTPRVYELYTPTELVEKSYDYNEIIIAQKNQKKHDELNEKLQNPKILGIYCYDEITPNDIESAKNLGVGIVVVLTQSYTINYENRFSLKESLAKGINYFSDVYCDDMKKRRGM